MQSDIDRERPRQSDVFRGHYNVHERPVKNNNNTFFEEHSLTQEGAYDLNLNYEILLPIVSTNFKVCRFEIDLNRRGLDSI